MQLGEELIEERGDDAAVSGSPGASVLAPKDRRADKRVAFEDGLEGRRRPRGHSKHEHPDRLGFIASQISPEGSWRRCSLKLGGGLFSDGDDVAKDIRTRVRVDQGLHRLVHRHSEPLDQGLPFGIIDINHATQHSGEPPECQGGRAGRPRTRRA